MQYNFFYKSKFAFKNCLLKSREKVSSGVAVKMDSPKKVLPSTYFRGNKYSPVYISQIKITPGIAFFSRK